MTPVSGTRFETGGETSDWADKGYVSAVREAAFDGPG